MFKACFSIRNHINTANCEHDQNVMFSVSIYTSSINSTFDSFGSENHLLLNTNKQTNKKTKQKKKQTTKPTSHRTSSKLNTNVLKCACRLHKIYRQIRVSKVLEPRSSKTENEKLVTATKMSIITDRDTRPVACLTFKMRLFLCKWGNPVPQIHANRSFWVHPQ